MWPLRLPLENRWYQRPLTVLGTCESISQTKAEICDSGLGENNKNKRAMETWKS